MRIVLTGDWHLDRSTAGYDRFDDISNGIDKTVELFSRFAAEDSDPPLYVFLGDLANPRNIRSHRAVARAIEVTRLLFEQTSRLSLWISGNHDVIEDGNGASILSPLAATDYCCVMDRPAVQLYENRLSVVALPYPTAFNAYDPAEVINNLDVRYSEHVLVVGHLSMTGATLGSETTELARGRIYEWPVKAIRERWPAAIMVGGHYHRQHSCNGVWFAGSLARLGFDEETNDPAFLTLKV